MTEYIFKWYIYIYVPNYPFSKLTLNGNLGLQKPIKDKSQRLGIEAQQI